MKKTINGIEVTDDTFKLVTVEEFDNTLNLILNEEHGLYSGFMEFERLDDIDFIPSYMTDDITDGKRIAMLSLDQIETKEFKKTLDE